MNGRFDNTLFTMNRDRLSHPLLPLVTTGANNKELCLYVCYCWYNIFSLNHRF
ncbi:hypothetical protein BDF14DRAFT_1842517 [Spinellus fusiger]|nr:hypothetical protein BDF14DRAFT_1842517 [Spinellus fusiger]